MPKTTKREWYNKEQKERYIEMCKYELTTIESIKVLFTISSMVESRNKKDLSLFDSNQIIELLKKINSKSRKFLRATCVFFSDYYNWCVSENLVPSNNLGNPYDVSRVKGIIDMVIPKEVLKNKFFIKEEFYKYLDNLFDPSNKLLAYCLYLGIRGQENEEIRKLKSSDLNEKRKEVRLFNLKSYFADMLFEKRTEANKIHLKNHTDNLNAQTFYSSMNLFQQVILYVYLIYMLGLWWL
jgi:hypothetical protein